MDVQQNLHHVFVQQDLGTGNDARCVTHASGYSVREPLQSESLLTVNYGPRTGPVLERILPAFLNLVAKKRFRFGLVLVRHCFAMRVFSLSAVALACAAGPVLAGVDWPDLDLGEPTYQGGHGQSLKKSRSKDQ